MNRIRWGCTATLGVFGGIILSIGTLVANGAPQEAAVAAIAIGTAVIPYVIARSLDIMSRPAAAKLEVPCSIENGAKTKVGEVVRIDRSESKDDFIVRNTLGIVGTIPDIHLNAMSFVLIGSHPAFARVERISARSNEAVLEIIIHR